MSCQSIGSVFSISPDRYHFYSQRLEPQNNHNGKWGYSSQSGFISKNENFLECSRNYRQVLIEHKVTYNQCAERLISITEAAFKALPGTLIENKFMVTISQRFTSGQYCPFSQGSDDDVGRYYAIPLENYCGLGDRDIKIVNTLTNDSIKFSSLLPHLIKDHHFFGGEAFSPYLTGPLEIIKTTEIPEDPNFSTPEDLSDIASTVPSNRALHSTYVFIGKSFCQSKDLIYELSERNANSEIFDFGDNVKGLFLHYSHGFDDSPQMGWRNDIRFLHIFNPDPQQKTFEVLVEGITLKALTIQGYTRLSLVIQP